MSRTFGIACRSAFITCCSGRPINWARAISQAPTDQPLDELLALLQTDGPHFMAATMGIVLLADQMALPHYASLTGAWLADQPQGQCSLLEELARRLMERGRPEIRLALKAVFQREFGHAIDEVPFNGIDPAGKLVPRRASGSSGARPPGS